MLITLASRSSSVLNFVLLTYVQNTDFNLYSKPKVYEKVEAVQKRLHDDPMRIGIGTKDEAPALGEMQCDTIVTATEFVAAMQSPISPLRPGDNDVVVVVNPKILSMDIIKRVADQDIPIEVAGHDPIIPRNYEERRQLRALKANVGGQDVPDGRGRPRVHEVAQAHVYAAIADWHAGQYVEGKWRSTYTPAGIWERAKQRTGLDLPRYWARNIVIAEFGSAVRNPDDLPKKDQAGD